MTAFLWQSPSLSHFYYRVVLIQPHWLVGTNCQFYSHATTTKPDLNPDFELVTSKPSIFFFIQSVVNCFVCLVSLSCCTTNMCLSLRSQTDWLTFSTKISEKRFYFLLLEEVMNWKAAPDLYIITMFYLRLSCFFFYSVLENISES